MFDAKLVQPMNIYLDVVADEKGLVITENAVKIIESAVGNARLIKMILI
jgi:hypothetical protein